VGMVQNTREFYAACDLIAVPSSFDPCPYVVLEAASRGIPVIVSEGVGNANSAIKNGAGLLWQVGQSFAFLVDKINQERSSYSMAALKWVKRHTLEDFRSNTISLYDNAMSAKRCDQNLSPVAEAFA